MQKERYQSQINQNFATICHTEVCLSFSRLAAKLSEIITRFWDCNLKIQHPTSFDLNGLKNGLIKIFENSLKSIQIFQVLMGDMNLRERSQKNQMSSAVHWDWCRHHTPHCWGRLVFLRPLPEIHTSHQYLEDMHWFEAIFKNFGQAVFEAIKVKGCLMLNFEVMT